MKDLTEQISEEMSGERGAHELALRALADLRAENDRLRAEIAALRADREQRG